MAVGMASLQCFLGGDGWEREELETQRVFLSVCEYQVDLGPRFLHFLFSLEHIRFYVVLVTVAMTGDLTEAAGCSLPRE